MVAWGVYELPWAWLRPPVWKYRHLCVKHFASECAYCSAVRVKMRLMGDIDAETGETETSPVHKFQVH